MTPQQLAEATGDYAAAGMAMPAERFYDLWRSTGMTYRELAVALGMTGRHAATHLREMSDGVRRVPGPTGVALQAIADGWRPGAWPEADEIEWLIDDCVRLAEHPNARPVNLTIPGCEPGGYNGLGTCFRSCAAMLRRLTGRGA